MKYQTNQRKKKLTLASKLNGIDVQLIVDTGSDLNFISKEVAEKIPNSCRNTTQNTNITLSNGTKEEILEKYTVTFIEIRSGLTCKEEFHVLQSLPYDGILGQQFLQKHNCIISFKNKSVTFQNNEQTPLDIDETILNKIHSPYSVTKYVKQVVADYKSKNPPLGLIKGCKMHLYLEDNIPVRQKPYPIALSYIPKVREEIKKLMKLNIIRRSESSYAAPAFPKTKKMVISDY
ncbi:Retroviral-like aspartic protease 1 [Nosema granulosis]|uniref:Retroviral-like aspartic protease 1 n=1 Tax=Nosema granulosis TaxID=83296 RepID=A0A9P6GWZ5_9MICR|nr:Retroviral-like aspartic protease 1 [Nosema granulosis]